MHVGVWCGPSVKTRQFESAGIPKDPPKSAGHLSGKRASSQDQVKTFSGQTCRLLGCVDSRHILIPLSLPKDGFCRSHCSEKCAKGRRKYAGNFKSNTVQSPRTPRKEPPKFRYFLRHEKAQAHFPYSLWKVRAYRSHVVLIRPDGSAAAYGTLARTILECGSGGWARGLKRYV